jgi:hypothetical protein
LHAFAQNSQYATGYRVFFPGVKRPGSGINHPPPSSAEIKEKVDLYLYSLSGHSWPVLEQTYLLNTTNSINSTIYQQIHRQNSWTWAPRSCHADAEHDLCVHVTLMFFWYSKPPCLLCTYSCLHPMLVEARQIECQPTCSSSDGFAPPAVPFKTFVTNIFAIIFNSSNREKKHTRIYFCINFTLKTRPCESSFYAQ